MMDVFVLGCGSGRHHCWGSQSRWIMGAEHSEYYMGYQTPWTSCPTLDHHTGMEIYVR